MENVDEKLQYSQMDVNIMKKVPQPNPDFVEAVNNVAASSSSSEVVYAFDSEGNEVAIGLLVSGPFEEVSPNHSSGNCQWIAAEEECGSAEVVAEKPVPLVKEEMIAKERSTKPASVVRTCQKKNFSKKTLKQLKAQLDAAHKKARDKKFSGSSKGIGKQRRKKCTVKICKNFIQKKTIDRLYKAPSSVRKCSLPCNSESFTNMN